MRFFLTFMFTLAILAYMVSTNRDAMRDAVPNPYSSIAQHLAHLNNL